MTNVIPVTLIPVNKKITGGKELFRAVVKKNGDAYVDDIAEAMVADGCDTDAKTIKYVLDKAVAAIPRLVKSNQGLRVHMGNLCTFYARVAGSWENKDATIAASRAVLDVTPSGVIRVGLSDVKFVNTTNAPEIAITAVYSLGSSMYNELEREADVIVTGKGLRVSESAEDEGLFLVKEDGTATKLTLKENNSFQLRAAAPGESFATGNYTLELRSRDLEDPATAALNVAKRSVTVVE